MKTYYDTLQVLRSADQAVIKGAYRSLSQKYHPDKNPEDPESANTNMQRLNEAYAVLSDEKRRANYDNALEETESDLERETRNTPGPSSKSPRSTAPHPGASTARPTYANSRSQTAREKAELRSRFEHRSNGKSEPIYPEFAKRERTSKFFARVAIVAVVTISLAFLNWWHTRLTAPEAAATHLPSPSSGAPVVDQRKSIPTQFARCAGNPSEEQCNEAELRLQRESAAEAAQRRASVGRERQENMQLVKGSRPRDAACMEIGANLICPTDREDAPVGLPNTGSFQSAKRLRSDANCVEIGSNLVCPGTQFTNDSAPHSRREACVQIGDNLICPQ